jgi:hypothetical protein
MSKDGVQVVMELIVSEFGMVYTIEKMIARRVNVSATKAARCVWRREQWDVKFTL